MNLTEKNANFYYSKKILKRTASRIFLERNLTLMPRLRKYCSSNLVLLLSFPANKCKVLAGKRYHSLKKSYQTPERTTRKVTQRILIKIFVLPKWSYFSKFIKQFLYKKHQPKISSKRPFWNIIFRFKLSCVVHCYYPYLKKGKWWQAEDTKKNVSFRFAWRKSIKSPQIRFR